MFWAANLWHNAVSLAGKQTGAESTAQSLNSKLLLVKRQEQDTDLTPFHPCFSPPSSSGPGGVD